MSQIAYDVGGVTFEPTNLRLVVGGKNVPLTGRAADTLHALVRRPGQLVSKDTLMAEVWPDVAVEENNLSQQVATLRRALAVHGLGDAIETVPRHGYRMRASVTVVGASPAAMSPRGTEPARRSDATSSIVRPRRGLAPVAFPAMLAVLVATTTGLGPARRWSMADRDVVESRRAQLRGEQLTREGNARGAVAELQRAVSLDSSNARAYSALAHALGRLGSTPSSSAYRPEGASPSVTAAARSVALDPMCAECRGTLGMYLFYHDWRWDEADKEYREALRLMPTSAGIYASYAMLLSATGRHDEALHAIDFALERQPYQVTWLGIRANALYFARRYDEAIAAADATLLIANTDGGAWETRARALFQLNRGAEAIRALAQQRFDRHSAELDRAVARGGVEAGLRLLVSTTDDWRGRIEHSWRRAPWRVRLGDVDGALDDVERAYSARRLNAIYLGVDPALDGIRDHPRFRAVLDGMGLTPVLARAQPAHSVPADQRSK